MAAFVEMRSKSQVAAPSPSPPAPDVPPLTPTPPSPQPPASQPEVGVLVDALDGMAKGAGVEGGEEKGGDGEGTGKEKSRETIGEESPASGEV